MTYELKVAHDSDSDVQPEVLALESPMVAMVENLDTDQVRVRLADDADYEAFEALMDSDDAVIRYRRVA